MNEEQTYHVPVLLSESVDGLNISEGGIYVDVTFGGGGHSREILSRLSDDAHLYSFDQDADAEGNVVPSPKFIFVRSNFRYLKNFMRYYGVEQIDGLLADLGVSSHHFDDSERGFSFRFDGDLDMRMNQRAGKTAADILNTYDEKTLADIFYIGGTKVGALFGEAVVMSNPDLHYNFRCMIKQNGGMLAKGRLLGLQFLTLLEDGLYFELGAHADRLAMKLKNALLEKGYPLVVEATTNQIFPIFPDSKIEELSRNFRYCPHERIDENHSAIRFCTSWATREEDVDALIAAL